MFQTLLAEFAAAWNAFVRIPLPAFLSGDGEQSDYPLIDGHPALLRIMMPLIGFVMGLFVALPVWLLYLLPSGRMAAGFAGLLLVPLALEIMTSWSGLTALAGFFDSRRQGASMEEALSAAPGSINDSRSGGSAVLMMVLYLMRMIFCGVTAYFSPFWFIVSLTGSWLVRADLASLNAPGGFGHSWLAVPRGMGKYHWYVAAGAMLAAGFMHPVGFILAYVVAWAFAWLSKNLCLESISGINRQALDVFGYCADLVLMFLGILLYAAP